MSADQNDKAFEHGMPGAEELPLGVSVSEAELEEGYLPGVVVPSEQDRTFTERLAETIGTLPRELLGKDHRLRRFGALAMGSATQAFDRGRAMVIVLPTTFDEVLSHAAESGWDGYQTASAAGLAVGGIFGAWGYVVGKTFHRSINEFPETTQKVTENHPAMVGVISDAVDGFPAQQEDTEEYAAKPEDGYDVDPYETRKTRLGKAALAVTRGLKTAFLFGTTAHVGVSKVSEHSDASTEKRLRVVAAEAAGVLGGVAAGVSALVTHDFLGAAEQVRDTITNKTYLTGAAFGFVGLSAISNLFSRRKFEQEMGAELSTGDPEIAEQASTP